MYIARTTKHVLMTSAATLALLSVPAVAQDTPENATPLGRIVVSAGAEKVAIDAPQSISVIAEEDIAEVQPGTIGDVLERSPGISTVGSESRFGESLNIRGIGGGASADEPRIVTVIDGVPKYYESYRQGSLFTDPEFFKSVEILRGPGSSTLYGAGALAGVVSLETKDGADLLDPGQTFGGDQKLEYRSNGEGVESTTFLAFAPDEQFDGLIGFIYDESDFLVDGDGDDIAGTRITEQNALIKGTYRFGAGNAHEIEGAFIRYSGEADDQLLDVIDFGTTFGRVDRQVTDTTAFLKYNYAPPENDLIDLTVQLSYGKSENEITDFVVPPPTSPFAPSEELILSLFDVDYAYETRGLRVENAAAFFGDSFENYLTFGIDVSRQDRISTRATEANAEFQPEGVTDTTGLFVQNEFVWDDQLTILVGARRDFQRIEPGDLVPTDDKVENDGMAATLALHYQLNDQFAVFGSAAYTERMPVVDELYDSRPVSGRNMMGQPITLADQISAGSLKNEESRNYELGVAYSQDRVFQDDDQLSFKTTAFRNNLDNLIARNADGVAGDPVLTNIDEAMIEGFEVEAAYESERFFGSLAYTAMEGENISDPAAINAKLENRIPADTVVLSLGTRLTETNLEFGWTGTHYESKSRKQSFRGDVLDIDTPSMFVQDIYAAWTPDEGLFADVTVRLGVTNVADKDYRTHLQDPAVRRAGRGINLSVSRTF